MSAEEPGFLVDEQGSLAPEEEDYDPRARALAERFSDERTSILHVFDHDPPRREYLVKDFLLKRESGLIVAEGGAGKGQTTVNLTVSLGIGHGAREYEHRDTGGEKHDAALPDSGRRSAVGHTHSPPVSAPTPAVRAMSLACPGPPIAISLGR